MPKGIKGFQKGHPQLNTGRTHFKKGYIPWHKGTKGVIKIWNRGKTKKDFPQLSRSGVKKGHIPWNKGKKGVQKGWAKGKEFSKETREKLRISHIGFHPSRITREKLSEAHRGEKCNFWKGGIDKLSNKIRKNFKYNQWRFDIFTRDNYICQECGDDNGGNLEAHHKKAFAILLKEFLQEYDQFSLIENKETLVRLAMKWKLLWDINNGKTLCEKCHEKTKSYLRRLSYAKHIS